MSNLRRRAGRRALEIAAKIAIVNGPLLSTSPLSLNSLKRKFSKKNNIITAEVLVDCIHRGLALLDLFISVPSVVER